MLPKRQSTSGTEGGEREASVSLSGPWARRRAKRQAEASGGARGLSWLSSLFAFTLALACGGEAALPSPGSSVADGGPLGNVAPEGDTSEDSPDEGKPAAADIGAPGITEGAYPEAPYGSAEGSIIADLELFGWKNPTAAQYDVASGGTVRLSDFYNSDSPAGEGTEFIMLNAVAAWCGVCRTEYQHLEDEQTYAKLAPRGLEMLGVLFEDNNGDPSTYADLTNWSRSYSVGFPFVNDPGFKTGVYFDKSATPMNMVIDARTMRIVLAMTGYNPLIYDEIDKLLTERGR